MQQAIAASSEVSVLADYELWDNQGQKVWQVWHDNLPLHAGQRARRFGGLTVGDELSPGQYTVVTGVFLGRLGQRVRVESARGHPGGAGARAAVAPAREALAGGVPASDVQPRAPHTTDKSVRAAESLAADKSLRAAQVPGRRHGVAAESC